MPKAKLYKSKYFSIDSLRRWRGPKAKNFDSESEYDSHVKKDIKRWRSKIFSIV